MTKKTTDEIIDEMLEKISDADREAARAEINERIRYADASPQSYGDFTCSQCGESLMDGTAYRPCRCEATA